MITTEFKCGEIIIPLIYKHNTRAKRLSLRMSSKEGSFILIIPPGIKASQLTIFLKQCSPWIEKNAKKFQKTICIKPGHDVILHGDVFRCIVDPLRCKPALCEITRTLRLPLHYLEQDIYDLLKQLAKNMLAPYVLKAAEKFGQHVEKITIRDQKSRWGSCSGSKTISLNWRLILAPPDVANYVCVHEAAHLLHMNHSVSFWKLVLEACPSYQIHKKWLKTHGPSLMAA